MADLNRALKKYSYGDGLTDQELVEVIDLFTRLEDDLCTLVRHFDPGYGLAHKAAMHELQRLECFARAREENKKK